MPLQDRFGEGLFGTLAVVLVMLKKSSKVELLEVSIEPGSVS